MYEREVCLVWKIENFSFCPKGNRECLQSPIFDFQWLDKCFNAMLLLFPRGDKEENENFLSCALSVSVDESSYFSRVCIFEIIGASGKILHTLERIAIFKTTFNDIALSSKSISLEEYFKDLECSAEDSLTIRCTLRQSNSDKNESKQVIATTKVGVTRESFEMDAMTGKKTIKEISTHLYEKFHLSIHETQGNLVVMISKPGYVPCFVECSLTMISQVGIGKCTYKANHFFSSSSQDWEFPSATLSRELESNGKRYIRNINNHSYIYFYCEFSCSNGVMVSFFKPETQSPILMDKTNLDLSSTNAFDENCLTLQRDMRILHDSKKLCDVKLKVGDQVLEAHKLILVARSPVFATMFDNDMTETHTGIVDIADADVHILKLFLKFLYTDTVEELSYEEAKDLLLIAEKYQVPSLKRECVTFLETEISVENVCDILTLAEAVNDEKLKTSSVDFIIVNSTGIISSPSWFIWMKNNMELATAILSQLSLNILSSKK